MNIQVYVLASMCVDFDSYKHTLLWTQAHTHKYTEGSTKATCVRVCIKFFPFFSSAVAHNCLCQRRIKCIGSVDLINATGKMSNHGRRQSCCDPSDLDLKDFLIICPSNTQRDTSASVSLSPLPNVHLARFSLLFFLQSEI